MDIQALIDSTVANGGHSCTVTGEHTIYKTIRIPSDFTLVLDDCHLTMADNTFCMMFCNASLGTPASHTLAGADRRIAIEGRGRAILDGGNYNGLSERDSLKDGRPHISVNNTILFANVEDFRISGLHIRNHRHWAINLVHCRRGVVRDIDFRADCTWVDENGAHHQGLAFLDELHDITVRNVYSRARCAVRLSGGMTNVTLDNINGFDGCKTIIGKSAATILTR